MNIEKEDKIQLATHNTEIALNAMKEQTERHKRLEEKGKSPEYILIYGQGYAEGVYDTKTELLPKISELKQELETYKKIAEKLANEVLFSDKAHIICRKVGKMECEVENIDICKQCINISGLRNKLRTTYQIFNIFYRLFIN